MCDGTLLPHCGHLFSCEACQRFAALRMRNRIFDVLRFGTPMAGAYKSITAPENNRGFRHSERNRAATQPRKLSGAKPGFASPWHYTTVTSRDASTPGSLRSG